MNNQPLEYSAQEIDTLIYSLLDNTITAESHVTLQQILRADINSRQRYRELSKLHSLLDERSIGAVRLTESGNQSVVSMDLILQRQRKRVLKRSLFAAAALVMLSLSILYFIETKPAQLATIEFSEHSAYNIRHPKDTPHNLGKKALVPGSSIEITQGTLEIELSAGVTSIIQAPAIITVIDDSRVELQRGIAWFDVSEEAKGFTVMTPQLEVVDLGTEFGISTDPTTAAEEVHVFKGKVTVTTRHKFKQSETLTAGKSRSVRNNGRLEVIPSNETLFIKELPKDLPSVSWDFDHTDGEQIQAKEYFMPYEVNSLTTQGSVKQVSGKYKKAASFLPRGGYITTDWKGIDSDLPRTIVCWIKCPIHKPTGAIIEWGIPLANSAKWRVVINPESQKEGGVKGALRTEFGDGYIIGSTDLRDGRWHQIISIYNGSGIGNPESIQLYVDGKQEKISSYLENEIKTILNNPNSKPVTIGKDFHGSIDSLRIFQGVMPADAFKDELEPINK